MLDLLKQYSVQDILIFIVILAIAIKGCISFFDWAYARIKQHFDKDNTEISKEKQTHSAIQAHTKSINALIKAQEQNIKQFDALQKSIEMLIESDKDDIKSWLVEKHHYFCYEKGYIDDYSLDSMERRYRHYEDEGGNSYAATLMAEVRALPKVSMMKDGHNN